MFNLEKNTALKFAVMSFGTLLTLSLSINVCSATATNGTNVRLRKEASANSEIVLDIADKNHEVKVVDATFNANNETWIKVVVDEKEGYIRSDLLNYTLEDNATVIDGPTLIRLMPSLSSNSKYLNDRLYENDRIKVITRMGDFYCIVRNNKTYFVHTTLIVLDQDKIENAKQEEGLVVDKEDLKEAKEKEQEEVIAEVETLIEEVKEEKSNTNATLEIVAGDFVYVASNLNFRSYMAIDASNIISTIKAGNKIEVLEAYPEWCKIKFEDKEGYVYKSYLEKVITDNKLVNDAMKFLGIIYNSPYYYELDGKTYMVRLDCSGLTSHVCNVLNGMSIPRTSKDQSNCGTRVTFSELQPGDLVFFYSKCSHVGLYIGEGRFIQAENNGIPIRISSFYNDKHDYDHWGKNFICGVRLSK